MLVLQQKQSFRKSFLLESSRNQNNSILERKNKLSKQAFEFSICNKNHKIISNPRNKLFKEGRKTIIFLITKKGKKFYTKKIKVHSSSYTYTLISTQKRNENKN